MIIKQNLWTKKACVSYFQICVLVIAVFAFSYMIYEVFEEVESVDAAEYGEVCCEETSGGNSCQTTSSETCNPDFRIAPTDCEFTDFCEIGCCVSSNNGLCNEGTSKRDCEKIDGEYSPNDACNIQECIEGCCILNDQAIWTTERNCEWEGNTENKDIPTEWNSNIRSEIECLFSVEGNKEGACIYDSDGERKCVFTTLYECVKRTGSEANFNREGKFCSDSKLDTVCDAKNHTGCIEGEEDVYWFDSCGNKEDVAKDCDLYRGTYCGKVGSRYECKDVNCDTDGDGITDRKNGESWCSYDGIIGDGKDPAGSRHMRHICYMGLERLDPCADYRNEICVQEDSLLGNGEEFSQAACRVNQWRGCLEYNKEKDTEKMKQKCEDNVDCWVKHINMVNSFKFDVCLPHYPPGYDLLQEDIYDDDGNLIEAAYYQASPADGICDIATMKCTSTWLVGGITCPGCIDNCKCHTNYFTQEMNDFCVALGDCGGYINYLGDYSDEGYNIRVVGGGNPGRLRSGDTEGFSNGNVFDGEPADPGDFDFFNTLNPELLPTVEREENSNLSAFEKELLTSAGAYGSPLLLKILTEDLEDPSSIGGSLGNIAMDPIGFARYTSAISSTKAGIEAQIEPGEDPANGDFSMVAAMLAGLIAFVITQSLIFSMLAAMLAFLLFMPCIIVHKHVYFSCVKWEPIDGGDKCNECNKVSFPCTEYRCESLGQLCHFINKGTGNELCVSKPVNETIPVITPFETAISEGFKYHNVQENGFEVVNETNNGCIEAYSTVDIGIKVEPFAKCKIGTDPKQDYNEMGDFFGIKGNYILPAHMLKLFFPNPEAFKNKYNLTEEQIVELGKIDYYVKCKSASGRINPEAYHIKTCINPGPDFTAPRVIITNPIKNSYLEYGVKEKNIKAYINEPSECKWSLEDKEFDEMENSMSCVTDPAEFTQFGWECNATLSELDKNTRFYFRCRDTSENLNTMVDSYIYELYTSDSKLSIDDVIPEKGEVIISNVEPVNTKLRLKTSGGAKNGKAVCEWEGNSYSDKFLYEDGNGSSLHDYDLTSLGQGRYTLNFKCEDAAGNIAENSTSFDVKIDKFGPRIIRIYYDNGLKLTTSEEAECKYDFKMNFNFENATSMGSSYGTEHYGPWRLKTYYVQCADDYGNKGERVKIRPYG